MRKTSPGRFLGAHGGFGPEALQRNVLYDEREDGFDVVIDSVHVDGIVVGVVVTGEDDNGKGEEKKSLEKSGEDSYVFDITTVIKILAFDSN